MELDQSSDASSTLNTCVIVDKLRNLRSWLSHLRGPYLVDRYRMKGDNRDEAPGSCQVHSIPFPCLRGLGDEQQRKDFVGRPSRKEEANKRGL